VQINGKSLIGKDNTSAMRTLRKAMLEAGPNPGIINSLYLSSKIIQSKFATHVRLYFSHNCS